MPFITIQTGAALSHQQKQDLASGLAEAITVIPGKNAGNLMLAIHDGLFMAFGDKDGKKCLHMNVLMYKAAAKQEKDALVERCTALFGRVCGIEPGCVYITIEEMDNWGVGGKYK